MLHDSVTFFILRYFRHGRIKMMSSACVFQMLRNFIKHSPSVWNAVNVYINLNFIPFWSGGASVYRGTSIKSRLESKKVFFSLVVLPFKSVHCYANCVALLNKVRKLKDVVIHSPHWKKIYWEVAHFESNHI